MSNLKYKIIIKNNYNKSLNELSKNLILKYKKYYLKNNYLL